MEVQRNAYDPSETMTNRVRVAEEASAKIIGDIRDRVRHAPSEVEEILGQAERSVMREAHEVGAKTREAGQAAMRAISPQTSPKRSQEGQGHTEQQEGTGSEEDEGWMSDQSGGPSAKSAAGTTGKSGRSKTPKLKIPKPKISTSRPVGSGSGRKRMSMRRGVLGQRPPVIQRSQSEDLPARRQPVPDAEEEGASASGSGSGAQTPDEGRGRSSAMRPPPGARHGSGVHTPRHMRIDSIRSVTQSREMSPARSVRFADEPDRSGYATPRIISPTSPSTPAHVSEAEAETEAEAGAQEDDSPRSQVRFSLPSGQEVRQS